MHYLYTPISVNNAPFLVKLTVEEYGIENNRRGYNILRIKMSSLQASQFSKMIRKSRKVGSSVMDGISVSELYSLVKQYDKEYIRREISKGNLVRIKKRSNQNSETTAPIAAGYKENASKKSIRKNDENVKTAKSLDVYSSKYNEAVASGVEETAQIITNKKSEFKSTSGTLIQSQGLNAQFVFTKANISQNAEKSNTKKSLDVNHYMTAVQNGDEKTAQKYVDEAAMQWGAYSVDGKTPLKLYHGTPNGEFYKFDKNKIGSQIYNMVLNVGLGKFDSKYHIYAITNDMNKRKVADSKSPAGSVDNLLKSDFSNNNIPQNAEKSNIIKSLDIDSEGNVLSEQQQKFFKDSKVRDENGKRIEKNSESGMQATSKTMLPKEAGQSAISSRLREKLKNKTNGEETRRFLLLVSSW